MYLHIASLGTQGQGAVSQCFIQKQLLWLAQYHLVHQAVSCLATALASLSMSKASLIGSCWIVSSNGNTTTFTSFKAFGSEVLGCSTSIIFTGIGAMTGSGIFSSIAGGSLH